MSDHSHHDHDHDHGHGHGHAHTHDHGHAHEHPHDHAHPHSHDHDDGDTYYIDQLCMVGLSGAFGVICLCLWFLQTEMLKNLLHESFHLYVLLSGIALVIVAGTRGWILWQQSRDPNFKPGCDHDHGLTHDHDHSHEHALQSKPPLPLAVVPAPPHEHGPGCDHEHKPGEVCAHHHPAPHAHHIGDAHVDADHDEADHAHGWAPWRYVVIIVPIILFLFGIPSARIDITTPPHEKMVGDFVSIIYEALAFIVLGVVLAGLLEEFVPQQAIAKIVPRNHVLAIMIGGLLGLVFPMCECGIIVVMKRLLRKGLPLSVCVAYMLAGPVINVVVMGSTFVAFANYSVEGQNDVLGGPYYVVAWRVGLAYLVAIVTALVVHWQWNRHGKRLLHPSVLHGLAAAGDDSIKGSRSWFERINNITQTALHDFVDITAFLVLGSVLAAGGKFIITESNIQEMLRDTPGVAILLMMGIAVLFCLCSEADAFVAANFPLFWPDGSKLAFLVLGPMLDLKLLLMYTRVFRLRLIYTIVICLVVQVFVYTTIVGEIFGKVHPKETTAEIDAPKLERTCLIASAILTEPDPLSQLVMFNLAYPGGKSEKMGYKQFYDLASRQDLRDEWKGRNVEVRGQYEPMPQGNDQVFLLSRLKITCCSSDLTQLRSPVIVREGVAGMQHGQWIRVIGQIDFRQMGNTHKTVLIVSQADDIVPVAPDPDPYVQ
ncbi:MAG: permease [Planctomycetes bacterium]|nr:permease [Planctomycetota bacterium]